MWFVALPGRTKVGATHKEIICEKLIDVSTKFPVYIWIRITFPTHTGAQLKWLCEDTLHTFFFFFYQGSTSQDQKAVYM